MTLAQVFLAISAVTAGLFSGLLMTILAFFQRALKDLSGPQFTLVVQRFLGIARTHVLNYFMVITTGVAPVVALALLRDDPWSPAFVLAALGLLAFWCGSILPSRFVAEPLYDDFLGWETDAPPKDWEKTRARYFRLNVVRGAGAISAFACFVLAATLA